MTRKHDKDVLDTVVELANNMLTGYEDYRTYPLDEAIDRALSREIDYGHHNNGNSWYRTTGYRYGITPRGVKQALRLRGLI